jgi:predicted glycosyltransferase/predicted transcriptional regulator
MSTAAPGSAPLEPTKVKKIWVAMSTPFQANFFAPLIQKLQGEFDFVVTAREHDNITRILDAKRIEHIQVGKHGGKELSNKLEAYAEGIRLMLPIVKEEKPDLLLTERWPEAVRVAFGLNIPSWTIFYDEREQHVNQLVFPLASRVYVPRFYTFQELYSNGVTDPDKVAWFNGFHTGYLKGSVPATENPYEKLGVSSPLVFVRPEPEFASFFPTHEPILEKAVEKIVKKDIASVAVLPRTESQQKRYSRMGVNVLETSMVESPVAHADVALGAAETMLMEAFILGKPAVSAIYWEASKPVAELHRYIPHSTDPAKIADYVEEYLDSDNQKAFSEKVSLLVKNMDNPAELMANDIRRLGAPRKVQASFKRRSRLEIHLDIIQAASLRPLRPTQIMKEANISYTELKGIIESLEAMKLLRTETTISGKYYQATDEGLKLLDDYRGLRGRLFGDI